MNRVLLLIIVLLGSGLSSQAQTLETIYEEFSETYITDLNEFLRNLQPAPVLLHELSEDSLASLWFLSATQAEVIVNLRRQRGRKLTARDLARALDLPAAVIRIFFSLKQDRRPGLMARQRLRRNSGDGVQSDSRLLLRHGSIEAGGLIEKDAGEKSMTDFFTGYVRKTFPGGHSLTAGQFTLRSGLGLLFSGPYGISALNSPAAVLRYTPPSVLPHRSTAENVAFRGAAARLNRRKMTLLTFISEARRDARISDQGLVNSLPESGYHRTESELETRDRLRTRSGGLAIDWFPAPGRRFGLTLFRETYTPGLGPPDSLRQRFALRGGMTGAVALSWKLRAGMTALYSTGELAALSSGARAGIMALHWRHERTAATFGFWHADPDFQVLYGALPGKNLNDTDNTTSIYAGLSARGRLGTISLYLLRSSTPWRTYFNPMPVEEQRLFLQWEHRPKTGLNLLQRVQLRRRPDVVTAGASAWQPPGKIITEQRRTELRSQTQLRLARSLSWRSRIDFSHVAGTGRPSARGLAWMNELLWKEDGQRLSARFTRFDVQSYDARIYQFEYRLPADLQGVFFNGSGWRFLATASVRLYASLRVSVYSWIQKKSMENTRRGIGVQINYAGE